MGASEGVNERIRPFILELEPELKKFFWILTVMPQILADLILDLFVLQIGLSV